MRVNEVTYEKLKTPLKVNGNLKRVLKIINYDLLDVFKSFLKLYFIDNDFK